MSLATTKARLLSVIGGVSGVATANVRARIATDIDRADAEAAYIASGAVNAWECILIPGVKHGGASGLYRSTARVKVYALFRAADAADSFGTFVALIESVMLALAVPTSGFPQLDEGGIRVDELSETPVLLRTGHSAYRCAFSFDLSDVDNT